MKTAKRVLALVVTVLLLVSSAAVAASAAYDLQKAIDSAAAGDTVTLPSDVTASVVIDKDLTLDLGGHELVGVDGEHAIVVKDANVTVRNGHVYSKFDNVRSVTLAQTVVSESPSAIRVYGGELTVEGLRVVGSFARIPTTSKYYLPTGSAIEAIGGAQVTVIQSSLVGRYGVNNKVNHSAPGGKVTIEDGILMGFMRVVKDMAQLDLPEDTEDVNAADRLEGFLNSGIKLEAREKKLMQTVFADRLHIYTKSVSDAPVVQTVSCDGAAEAVAAVDESRVWENTTSTDASYKFVPEYIVADGKLIAMTESDGVYTAPLTAQQAQGELHVKYRLEFVLQPDIQKYAGNFNAYLENLYGKVVKTVNEVYDYALEKYNKYMTSLYEVDDMLMEDLDDRQVEALLGKHKRDIPEYRNLAQKLFALGGAVMATKGEYTGEKLPASYVNAYTGSAVQPEPVNGAYIYGVLDRVALLRNKLDTYMPLKGSEQSRWPEMVKWAYDNYEEVLSILDDGENAILDLKQALSGDTISTLLTLAPKAKKQAAKLDTALDYIDTLQEGRDILLSSSTVQTVLKKLANNESEIKPYVQKFISMYNNHNRYFTPGNFLLEGGKVGKAYAVYADPEITDGEVEHQWKEVERIPATTDREGKIVYVCEICGETMEETIPMLDRNVLWAGYEQDVVDEKLLESYDPYYMYVVARKGEAADTPIKVQIRSSYGTMTYTRDHESVKAIADIVYDGKDCELWSIDRGMYLVDDTYTAVAKYGNGRGFAEIENAEGASFTVVNPVPVYDNTVYSAKIDVIGADGVIAFDGVTKQTITVVTGIDVTKVQLRNDADDGTMTYNQNNAAIAEDTLEDGTSVLVWTIERLFAKNEYNYSIYTRSPNGLLDSDKDLAFVVKADDAEPTDDEKLISVAASVQADNSVVFTVKTIDTATKVKFTNTDDNGTMTFDRNNARAVVTDNGDGTATWVITIQHVESGETHYNVQALVRTYSAAKTLTISVPEEVAE